MQSKISSNIIVNKTSLKTRNLLLIAMLFVLTACGGSDDATDAVSHSITTSTDTDGTVSPASATVADNQTSVFTITPNNGFAIDSVSGCGGSLSGNIYTTGEVNADCSVTASFKALVLDGSPIVSSVLTLTYNAIKVFQFNWTDVSDATHYKLMENSDGMVGFSQVGSDIAQGVQNFSHIVPLYARVNAQYLLQSCNAIGCTDSAAISVVGNLIQSVGYLKASNSSLSDSFGFSTSLSGDGSTLAVGVLLEDSSTVGINTVPNEAATDAGAVYVFIRNGFSWEQEAYIKASNTGTGDGFGVSVAFNADGNTLVVGATEEDSGTSGINTSANEAAVEAGAVYVFTRDNSNWQQEAYIKAGNVGEGYRFGTSVSLSSNGNTLAVGARGEDSNSTGINSTPTPNNFSKNAGAAYIFTRSGDTWTQRDYIKGSNTSSADDFGSSISLSADGNVLAVGASSEDRNAMGVNDTPVGRMANSGAVFVFDRTVSSWTQRAYIKADQINVGDVFGGSVSLSADGNLLAVGAAGEDSSTTGINTMPDEKAESSGAVYMFSNNGSDWSQQAYIKASNTGAFNFFGSNISLSADGNALAVSAVGESSSTTGINSTPDDTAIGTGAAYIFNHGGGVWAEQAYVKASNTEAGDQFGDSVSLSADGKTLAVGASSEDSATSGVNSIPDENTPGSGAVYLY